MLLYDSLLRPPRCCCFSSSPLPPFRHQHSRSLGANHPLKSIVEDLKVRPKYVSSLLNSSQLVPGPNSPHHTTHKGRKQPVFQFTSIATLRPNNTPTDSTTPDVLLSPLPPPIPSLDRSFTFSFRLRRFHTTRTGVRHTAHLQRKQSRSSSRRPGDGYSSARGEAHHP